MRFKNDAAHGREAIGCTAISLYRKNCPLRYRSFGIAAQREAAGHWQVVCKVSDVSTDPVFVENLAARCTAGQLEPVHLMDIIEDALI